MQILGLCMSKVKAIFISHEHTDHIKGVESIAEKFLLPVYLTEATAQRGRLHFKKELINYFKGYQPISIGSLEVTAFPKFHDAVDPHSFIITGNGITVGVFTDIGVSCSHVTKHFSQCHAAFLEANYDETMLDNGSYPAFLKNRIRGGHGHLSNKQALEIFITHRPAFMSHLLLSHLSQDNNCPVAVHQLFNEQSKGTKIIIASRLTQTPLYTIANSTSIQLRLNKNKALPQVQLSLF